MGKIKVLSCLEVYPDAGIYQVEVQRGFLSMRLYLGNSYDVGDFVEEGQFLEGLDSISTVHVGGIIHFLEKFGSFSPSTCEFSFFENVEPLEKTAICSFLSIMEKSASIHHENGNFTVRLATEAENTSYVFELGQAIERLRWMFLVEPLAIARKKHNEKNRENFAAANRIKSDRTTERHKVKIKDWLKNNGYYPKLKRTDPKFLNRDTLAQKICDSDVLKKEDNEYAGYIGTERIKQILREIYKDS